MPKMTDAQVMTALRSANPINRARAAFSHSCARIEQACQQRRPPSAIEIRRMEFEAVAKILGAFGISEDLLLAVSNGTVVLTPTPREVELEPVAVDDRLSALLTPVVSRPSEMPPDLDQAIGEAHLDAHQGQLDAQEDGDDGARIEGFEKPG